MVVVGGGGGWWWWWWVVVGMGGGRCLNVSLDIVLGPSRSTITPVLGPTYQKVTYKD